MSASPDNISVTDIPMTTNLAGRINLNTHLPHAHSGGTLKLGA